jgi:hypothetical protein
VFEAANVPKDLSIVPEFDRYSVSQRRDMSPIWIFTGLPPNYHQNKQQWLISYFILQLPSDNAG